MHVKLYLLCVSEWFARFQSWSAAYKASVLHLTLAYSLLALVRFDRHHANACCLCLSVLLPPLLLACFVIGCSGTFYCQLGKFFYQFPEVKRLPELGKLVTWENVQFFQSISTSQLFFLFPTSQLTNFPNSGSLPDSGKWEKNFPTWELNSPLQPTWCCTYAYAGSFAVYIRNR